VLKLSKFNVEYQKDGSSFLYNSHSGAFVKLNSQYQDYLKKLKSNQEVDHKIMEEFNLYGFLVDKERDELGLYKYLHKATNYSSKSFHLTVATTLQCNFRCPYCYEEHVDEYLEGDKKEHLKTFLKDNMKNRDRLSITWYGGEPLLMKSMIYDVSQYINQLSSENDFSYEASIVSNGYLLDRKTAKYLANECNVKTVQITLDGGPETHNLTRILRNGGGTFDKIINNIKEINDLLNIQIRVNVSKENVNDIYKLFPTLLENGLNKKVRVYFAPVTPSTSVCQSISETCLITKEFSKWETDLIEYADNLGFEMGDLYPVSRRGGICQAVNDSAFVVDATGDLFKCWHEVGNRKLKVGTLKEGITNLNRLFKWMNWELPEKCNSCNIMPLCKGRCPDLSLEKEDFECHQLKFNITDRLHRYYIERSNKENMIEKVKSELVMSDTE